MQNMNATVNATVNSTMNAAVMTVGKILLVLIFFISGIGKVMNFAGTSAAIASKGLPLPDVLTVLTIALEIVAPFLLVFNRFAVWAALALAAFCVATGVFFHNFWTFEDAALYRNQLNHFMKNIALAGAFLTVAATPSTAKT
jgi:putative oxidoreductase